MDIQPTADLKAGGAVPTMLPPATPEGGGSGARGIIIGLGGIWVAAGLYIAPIATLIWVFGVGAICAAASWWSQWLDERTYERVAQGCCAQCGYDLRGCGQSGDCPECGAWFGLGWGAAIPADKKKALADGTPEPTVVIEEPGELPKAETAPPQEFPSAPTWTPDHPLQGL